LAVDDVLAKRVRTALERQLPIEEKKMFGGIAFMVRGKMCVSVGRDRLMCRIDPLVHDTVLQHKGCRTMIMRGREYRGYVHIDAEAVKTERELDFWIALSLDYNGQLQASLRKRR